MIQECVVAAALASCAAGEPELPDTLDAEAEAEAPASAVRDESPSVLVDHAAVYGATLVYAAAYGHVRNQLLEKGSWSNIADNFRDPIGRAIEGARNDNDPFETNYIAHPVTWGLVGYFFRSRGHGFLPSLLMSQGHSVFWEYVIEGSYAKPSGKDLITNFVGAGLGILIAGWWDGDPSPVALEVTPAPATRVPLVALPPEARDDPGVRLTVRVRLTP